MIDFGTLVVELLKYQDELARRDITVNIEWGENYQLDTLTLSTTNCGYKQYLFQLVRAPWNERMEFSISCNGGGSFFRATQVSSNGVYYFRVDPRDGQPIGVNKETNIGSRFMFGGWSRQQMCMPDDLQYFAHNIYEILSELAGNLRQADNCYHGEMAQKICC